MLQTGTCLINFKKSIPIKELTSTVEAFKIESDLHLKLLMLLLKFTEAEELDLNFLLLEDF